MSVPIYPRRTVIVASYRIYGEPIAPLSGRGQPTTAINGAGEIVEVEYRVGTVELIADIPADLDSHLRIPTPVPPSRAIPARRSGDGPT